ncbi:MAG TPA: DNA repair protein RecO [Candidatus Omnitrophota bacterium]|jgi:DNA repair protein RecO (recombination protein O)|nr:MAG: DNA repair protein RecO [Candidatus Omnitrophica bacterium ADurb.Bin314]HOE69151.1 DNA repair protein RecO [Candidatus Omnitrophota bacterium]HPW64527.1 DNA repair protein RecO [Candidatus Omnitrophota bacterium]HQB93919.1 DNA repair protein RecO [Candidatus Omnitrophota bacterium]
MSIHKVEGIVLKTQPFRSSSLIVTFFTKEAGKIRGVVKGVHREGEIRQAGFEIFTRAEIIFYEKRRSDLHLISDAAILESNDPIRNRLESIVYGSYFCELVDELTEVQDPHPEIFELLRTAFRFLSVVPPEKLTTVFTVKLLGAMGWIPYTDGCVSCGARPLEKGYFSVKQGALLCEACRSKDGGAPAITPVALALLRVFIRNEMRECLEHSHFSYALNEVQRLLTQFLNFRIGKVLRTKRFIDSVRSALVK